MTHSRLSLGDDARSSIVRFGIGFVAFLFLVSAPVSGYFLTRIFLEARASANWPSVMGGLTKAHVGETSVGRYHADVAYSYRVGGDDFIGSKVYASDGEYNIRDGAVQAIRGLTVGQPVAVFYDPSDPRRAVLHPGAGFPEYARLLVSVVMLGVGIGAFRLLGRAG